MLQILLKPSHNMSYAHLEYRRRSSVWRFLADDYLEEESLTFARAGKGTEDL